MRRAVLSILLLLLSVSHVTADQDIIVSKGFPGENTLPSIAASTTGDFIVTWAGETNNGTRVLYRLFKRRGDGTYSASPVVSVTGSKEFAGNPSVVYIPWKNQYLLTWGSFVLKQTEPDSISIVGQLIKKNGKLAKKRITMVDDGALNGIPRVAVIDTPQGPLPKETRSAVLIYTAIPSSNKQDGNGVIVRGLNPKNFKPRGSRITLVPVRITDLDAFNNAEDPITFTEGLALALDVVAMRNWYVISVITSPPPTFDDFAPAANIPPLPYQARFAWMRVDNGKKGKLSFNRPTDVFIAKQAGVGFVNERPATGNGKEFSDTVDFVYGDRNARDMVFGTFVPSFKGDVSKGNLNSYEQNGGAHRGELEGGFPQNQFEELHHGINADLFPQQGGAPAAGTPYGYYVFSRDGKIQTQALMMGNDGKVEISKDAVDRVSHGGSLEYLTTEAIPGFGTFVIAWEREIDFDNLEIRVHIYSHDDK